MIEKTDDLFYQESGKYDITGFIFSIAVYLIVAIFIGYFYTLVVTIFPIVYFNFIIAITVAAGLGMTVKNCHKIIQKQKSKE
jgi:CDP-diglyceride synthetase